MTTGSQAEFARKYNYSRAAITQFKHSDRLVFVSKGVLDFELSVKRIKQTAEPNRDHLIKRHAKKRESPKPSSQKVTHEQEQSIKENSVDQDTKQTESTFQDSRALKEKYLALQAKVDYEKSRGLLVERSEVERDFIRIATIMRSAFERMPDFLAAEFATEDDPNRIRAMLTDEIEAALRQGADQISKLK